MNSFGTSDDGLLDAVLQALPIGVAVFDGEERLLRVNDSYCRLLDVASGAVKVGMTLEAILRASAYRGQQGFGEPEELTRAALTRLRGSAGVFLSRRVNGRSFDLRSIPTDGGFMLCAVETTRLLAAHEEATGSMARLSTALATMRNGVAVFAPDRALLMHNPRFAELLGLPPERIGQTPAFDDMIGLMADRHEFADDDGRAFLRAQGAMDRTRRSTVRRIRPNGQVVDVASDPLPDGGWTITVVDISPLAHAEDDAIRRASMLDSILANIPHGVCVYGADRRVTMFNRAYTEIMDGAPLAVGDDLATVIRRRADAGEYGGGHPADVFSEQLGHDITRPQVRRRQRPNGTTVDVRTAPLPDGGHISVVTDVTPLNRAETALLHRAAEMDVMLENTRHGITLFNAEWQLVATNHNASEVLGLPHHVLRRGRGFKDILASILALGTFGEGPAARHFVECLQEGDRSASSVYRRRTVDGRVIEIRSDPAASGGFVLTFMDVTESEGAQEQLRRAKLAAEAANQAKSRFLATMSHELRTPLNAVIGFSETLLRSADRPDPGQVGEFAVAINEAGRHLLGLINTILDVARIEAGRFDMSSDTIDLDRLLRACARQAEPSFLASELTLEVELSEALPVVRADERRLRQVLNSLLSNAAKFTPFGTVTLSAAVEFGSLILRVTDTGIGIPDSEIERVFEPFIQLDGSLARQFQGAGLGLYVSRSLIEAHGGELRLRSELGVGTTAEVVLPGSRLVWDGVSAKKDVA